MILDLQRALKDDGVVVSLVKLCNWFGVPRRTVYYKPTKGGNPPAKALTGEVEISRREFLHEEVQVFR